MLFALLTLFTLQPMMTVFQISPVQSFLINNSNICYNAVFFRHRHTMEIEPSNA